MEDITSRTTVINALIDQNALHSYVEIGVSNPYANYLDISCDEKHAVDPCLEMEYFSEAAMVGFKTFIDYQMTSDDFFAQNTKTFDIFFIDGDHSYPQSLTDVNHALAALRVGGFIVLHDSCPPSYEMTQLSNFEKKLPYTGDVWKTTLSAIHQGAGSLMVGTVLADWGVTIIKKLNAQVPEIRQESLEYARDFSIPALAPLYDLRPFYDEKVSYFTSLFNTPQAAIARTAATLLHQHDPHWEWVVVDDSDNAADRARLQGYFTELDDRRVHYFAYSERSRGVIGLAKWRAATLCTGQYLAELDHDDLLMPTITGDILTASKDADFIYSNWADVKLAPDGSLSNMPLYGAGFAMGYGSYRETEALNPVTGAAFAFQECVAVPLNPKTIRHIVGVPNHIRVWARDFYFKVQGHNPALWVADDYELVVRSFLAGGRFLHLDTLGYLQVNTGDNTTDKRRQSIQTYVAGILAHYDTDIKDELERRGIPDWAYAYHKGTLGFQTLRYWDVPSLPDPPRGEATWRRGED